MVLADVAPGDPHTAAHNAERHKINEFFEASVSAIEANEQAQAAKDQTQADRLAAEEARDEAIDISHISTSDGVITAIDNNAASAFRIQQDARNAAKFVAATRINPAMKFTGDYANLQAAVDALGYKSTKLMSSSDSITLTAPLEIHKETMIDMLGTVLTQADGTNLSSLVNISLTQAVQTLRTKLDMFVVGNRYANAAIQTSPWNGGTQKNTGPLVGFNIAKTKKAMTALNLGVVNCDTGVLFEGDNEYTEAHIGVDYCGTGVHVTAPTNSLTSDELMLFITAHECGTAFLSDGLFKTSGTLFFAVEQTLSYAANISNGRWHLFGELRGIGKAGDGGFKVGPMSSSWLDVDGILALVGGSDTNCEWLADLQGGNILGLALDLSGQYKDGVRIGNTVTGSSAKITMTNTPANPVNPVALKLDGTKGFTLLPGSNLRTGATGKAIWLVDADDCTLEPSILAGLVHFDANSGGNKLVVPRGSFASVTFQNDRTADDNVVIFKGNYALATLDAMPVKFRGMHAESVTEFARNGAYYDGKAWIAVGGLCRNPAGVTIGRSVTTTSGSPNLTGTFTSADVGMTITGTGIPAATTIVSQTGTAAVMSANATASATIIAPIGVLNGMCGGLVTIPSGAVEVSIVHNLGRGGVGIMPGRVALTPMNIAAGAAPAYADPVSSNTLRIKVPSAAASDLIFDYAIRSLT